MELRRSVLLFLNTCLGCGHSWEPILFQSGINSNLFALCAVVSFNRIWRYLITSRRNGVVMITLSRRTWCLKITTKETMPNEEKWAHNHDSHGLSSDLRVPSVWRWCENLKKYWTYYIKRDGKGELEPLQRGSSKKLMCFPLSDGCRLLTIER